MKLSTIKTNALGYYLSGISLYMRSAPGRGKSTVMEELPQYLGNLLGKNLGLVVVSGPNLQPGDTVGFGVPKHNADGTSEMVFTRPFFWRTDEGKWLEEYDGGIIFVDEADKMDVDIKKVMGEMALSGRCGPHRLPKGWVVWMAGNRQGDRSGSTKELDHLINRRLEIDVTDDLAGWEEWAIKNGVHHAFITFAMQNAGIVFSADVPEKQGPFCTPRSLVNLSRVMVALAGNSGDIPTNDDAVETAAGMIGQAAAAQLFATLRLELELPKPEVIAANPKQAKIPGDPGAQMLACYKLAALADDRTLAPFIAYIERLPADFVVTFGKALCGRSPLFAVKPPMLDLAKRNSALLAMMSTIK